MTPPAGSRPWSGRPTPRPATPTPSTARSTPSPRPAGCSPPITTTPPPAGWTRPTSTRPAAAATQNTHYINAPTPARVPAVSDSSVRIGYDYDADGHTTAVHYPDGTTTAATYKDTGQLATSTDITGAVTSYSYNPAGDLTGATQTRGDTNDSLDRVATITRGNGVRTAITYTDANQVKTQTTTAANGTTLQTSSYSYDAHGNLHSRTDQTPAAPGAARRRGPAKTLMRGQAARRQEPSSGGDTRSRGATPSRGDAAGAAPKPGGG